jgi:hypothetical protein
MGFPAMRVRDFPGKREEANRAGITPRNLFGTIDLITSEGALDRNFGLPVGCENGAMTKALLVRLLILGSLVYATTAAQTREVQISGRVVDPAGAAISNGCVTLKGAGSADKAAVLTNYNGEFVFGGLAPGTYDLSFTWRERPLDTALFKSRSLTFKADNTTSVVPPVVLEVGEVTAHYDYDSLREYQSKFRYGSEELHNQCTLDLGSAGVTCPSTPEELAASKRNAHYLRLEADGQKLSLVPLSGVTLALGQPREQSSETRCPAFGYSSKRMRVDNLPEANLICGLTEEGRRAELAVGFKEVCVPGGIIISYETRRQQTDR